MYLNHIGLELFLDIQPYFVAHHSLQRQSTSDPEAVARIHLLRESGTDGRGARGSERETDRLNRVRHSSFNR